MIDGRASGGIDRLTIHWRPNFITQENGRSQRYLMQKPGMAPGQINAPVTYFIDRFCFKSRAASFEWLAYCFTCRGFLERLLRPPGDSITSVHFVRLDQARRVGDRLIVLFCGGHARRPTPLQARLGASHAAP